jgi:hypothetical protein
MASLRHTDRYAHGKASSEAAGSRLGCHAAQGFPQQSAQFRRMPNAILPTLELEKQLFG